MDINQTNPSPDTSDIPQGIPTGVFVANNQPSQQVVTDAPVVSTPQIVQPVQSVQSVKEGPLNSFVA